MYATTVLGTSAAKDYSFAHLAYIHLQTENTYLLSHFAALVPRTVLAYIHLQIENTYLLSHFAALVPRTVLAYIHLQIENTYLLSHFKYSQFVDECMLTRF
jgi:uncharacterized membrane protein